MHHKDSSISLILSLSFQRFVRSVFKKCKICLRRQAIITSPPKSAVCSKLSPITLARPNLLLSCGTSHKVSSQSGSSYFTDSSTQKYSRNQNVETLYLWDVDGVRLETSVCLRVTVAEPNFPDNQNCPSRPCPQAESLWDITSLMQSTQDQRAPHNDPNPSPSFRNSTKKILMSYISSIDYNSTVVQIFVGHRKFQLAKCKLHLTMNRIVVYTYSIITQE